MNSGRGTFSQTGRCAVAKLSTKRQSHRKRAVFLTVMYREKPSETKTANGLKKKTPTSCQAQRSSSRRCMLSASTCSECIHGTTVNNSISDDHDHDHHHHHQSSSYCRSKKRNSTGVAKNYHRASVSYYCPNCYYHGVDDDFLEDSKRIESRCVTQTTN